MRPLLLATLALATGGCLNFPDALSRCEDAGRCDAPTSLAFSPSSVAFTRQDAGTVSPLQQLTLSNPGISPTGPIELSVTGAQASEFQLGETTCDAPLEAGASCQVEVRFAPQGPATRTAMLEAQASPGGRAVASLSGLSPDPVTLSVEVVGDGGGLVTVGLDGVGVSCGDRCAFPFERGSQVDVFAEPSTGSRFVEFSGGCSGAEDSCGLTLTADTSVTANFEVTTYLLELQLRNPADAGSARVTSVPPGISCPGTCSAVYLPDTVVTLTASASDPDVFAGWDGGACDGVFPVCRLQMTQDHTPSATFEVRTFPPNYAFITSSTVVAGSVGGLAGADAFCQAHAADAGLPGTYRAWVSSDVGPVHAIERLGSAEGWMRPDGQPVALSKADLASKRHLYPLTLDEHGLPFTSTELVATGSDPGGQADPGRNCNGFTSPAGNVVTRYSDYTWSAGNASDCATSHHLFCFGIDSTLPPTFVPLQGRKAFISSTSLVSQEGLAAADALCQADAAAAGLSGIFKAMLATSTQSAAARFDPGRATWIRVDGVGLALSAAEMFTQDPFRAAFDVTATGEAIGCFGVWTGSPLPDSVGTVASTCGDWTLTDSTLGTAGIACGLARDNVWGRTSNACSSTINRVYCLEQ